MKKKYLCRSISLVIAIFFLISTAFLSGCSIELSSFFSGIKENFREILYEKLEEAGPSGLSEETADSVNNEESSQSEIIQPLRIAVYIDPVIGHNLRALIIKKLVSVVSEVNSGIDNSSDNSNNSDNKRDVADPVVEELKIVYSIEEASLVFETLNDSDNASSESSKISEGSISLYEPLYFAVVSSFYGLIEEVSFGNFLKVWRGEKTSLEDIAGNEQEISMEVSRKNLQILENHFGKCGAAGLLVADQDEIDERIKNDNKVDQEQQKILSVVAFDEIKPIYKVLKVDGQIILDKNADSKNYPLTVPIRVYFKEKVQNVKENGSKESLLEGDSSNNEENGSPGQNNSDAVNREIKSYILGLISRDPLLTNRHSTEIASVIMTGVTALTRQVAAKMDKNGILYPAEKIREVLLDADITHISNEVSFVEDCYAAKPNTMVFCSKPEYIELLKFIDADVIELTGNHLNDYGSDWLKFTIDIYNLEGIPYFGGGINLEDSRKPALFEVNGNKLAFIGANSFGPSSDWATEASAGSAPINTLSEQSKELDMNYYEEAIKALRKKGYNVIFTFQYLETYNYSPTSQQVLDFERMSAAGAAVVSGSQAHQPQGIEISKNGFINFGLGNIFFGQALGKEVKQGIIAKHYFYRGRYIYTELITIFIEDFSQPRQTSGMERAELLKEVYNGSVMWQ